MGYEATKPEGHIGLWVGEEDEVTPGSLYLVGLFGRLVEAGEVHNPPIVFNEAGQFYYKGEELN